MKKLFIIFFVFFFFFQFIILVNSQDIGPIENPLYQQDILVNEGVKYQTDPDCSIIKITQPEFNCSIICSEGCIKSGFGCISDETVPDVLKDIGYQGKDICRTQTISNEIKNNNTNGIIENSVNFSGINLGPPETLIPTVSRIFLTFAFGVISLATIFMAIYGLIVRTTASESPEKIELSAKIFKNAFIGLAISTVGILIVQVIATLFGLSNSIFDFYLVPPIYIENLNDNCVSGTRGFTREDNTLKYFNCDNNTWQPQ